MKLQLYSINLKIKSTKNTPAKNDKQPIELFVKILFGDMS